MKKTLTTLFVVLTYCSLHSQDFNTMEGDWIRVNAEYADGMKVPYNHGSRIFVRYHFTKKEVYQVVSGNTVISAYTRSGNVFNIPSVQDFVIEEYTDKTLRLVEVKGDHPIRYYMIPTDSFQVSGVLKYTYEVNGADTIYTSIPGIEPIYTKGQHEFINTIMMGLAQKVAFTFTYVVQEDGTIGDVTVINSTNPKLNKRLIQLVKKSSGKWIPSTFRGKPIKVRQKETLSMTGHG